MFAETIITTLGVVVIVMLIAFIIGLITAFSIRIPSRRQREREQETIEQRINRLASALTEAAELIDQVESEIEERRSLATNLRRDVETYERITELKKPEVEAVAQTLRGELHRERNRSLRQEVMVNFVVSLVSLLLGGLLSRLLPWL